MSAATTSNASAPDQTAHSLKGFWHLFVVQFQGALSDNIFKFLVIFLITEKAPTGVRDSYLFWVLVVFALPFLLFSMTGGWLADRFRKQRVVVWVKVAEAGIMAAGALALVSQSIPLLLGVLFLMATQSAIFGPSKYGIIPELLPESRLSWGNGLIAMGTFVPSILGTVFAGTLAVSLGFDDAWKAGAGLVGLALLGVAVARGIPRGRAADPGLAYRPNFLGVLADNFRGIRRDRILTLALLGAIFFWFIAALFGEPLILIYGQDLLKLGPEPLSWLKVAVGVGIAVGSVVAGIVSGRKIEYGLVPLGGLGMALGAVLLAIPGLGFGQVGFLLILIGFFGGFFVVPVNALIQQRPDADKKGAVVATGNWLGWVGILGAAGIFMVFRKILHLAPTTIFLLGGLLTLAATILALRLVPDAFVRLGLWALTRTLYRVRVLGRENLPEKGGALLVANHLSFADALFLIASTDRQIRFLMRRDLYGKPWVRPFARMLKVIPVGAPGRPRELEAAFDAAREALRAGEVVCLFAEGDVSRLGQTLPFGKGMIRILEGTDAPVVPAYLDNAWGSIFSFERGRFTWKWPHRIPYPITVSFGEPLAGPAAPEEVREAVLALGTEAWAERRRHLRTIGAAFIRTARRQGRRFAIADSATPEVSFIGALTRSLFLERRLRAIWEGQEKVGLLLPPSVGGALANWAALLMGKVPVNLNYTLSEEGIVSCIEQCGLRNVVASRKLLDRLGFDLPVPVHALEDLAAAPRKGELVRAALLARLCPAWLLERIVARGARPSLDDVATVIFSSGSTGEPKGVMLSHYNVVSNELQLDQILSFRKDDRFLGILPFFHSFGFGATLAAPAVLGVGVAYHFNPVEAKVIGPLVEKHGVTVVLATPTFLQFYVRGCEAEQFRTVRFVAASAEKLPDRLAVAFEKKFGIRPLEGYGCTECSPAVTMNIEDFRDERLRQVGGRPGSIGRPLPGMAVRIVDPDSREPVAVGNEGLLLVKGPNVMLGYLGRPEKTAEVLDADGWYDTGDIVRLDSEGFLHIAGRLSRFSKIGGEMVPHIKVEETLHHVAGRTEQTFAVTGLPDDKKGEQLAVVHTLPEEDLDAVLEKLADADLPNLWKPRKRQFVRVEKLPMLGSGKLDLKALEAVAREALGGA